MARVQIGFIIGMSLATGSLPASAPAQPAAEATVSGQGTVTIERPAQLVRMQIDLSAKHKEAKEALAQLKQLREAATVKAIELGAVKESLTFGEPTLGTVGASSDAYMQRMVMLAMRGKKPDESKLQALPLVATVRLTAEWPLSGDTPDERLLYSHELREKIRAADLGGTKDAAALTPEEQELQEESESAPSYGMPQPPKPGEPGFVFVAKISEEERAKALKDAYFRAHVQAEQLAKAAGMRAALIRSLSGGFGPVESGGEYDSYSRYMATMMGRQVPLGSADDAAEAVGPQPGKVEYRVAVSATFGLTP